MKATYKHIAFAALALSAAACSQDDDFAPSYLSDPDAVRITAQVGTNDVTGGFTRSNPLGTAEEQAKFNTDDLIAVTAGTQAAVTYTLGTDDTWNPTGTDYLKWETETMDVTAYYPVGKNDASATTFTVPTGYANLAALADADYMTYSGEQTKGTDNSISLTMERKMVRLAITPEFNNQFATGYSVTAIKVHANTKGYANGQPETGDITVTALQHEGAFYALLAPTNVELNKTFMTVTVTNKTDDTDVHTLTLTDIPPTEAGKSYSLSLTVGKDVASIGSVSVADWTGATIPGGEAKEVLTKLTASTVASESLSGEGTEGDPYLIKSAADLLYLSQRTDLNTASSGLYYRLATDIEVASDVTWGQIRHFCGTFDGNGKTISGTLATSIKGFGGVFRSLSGTVKNLNVSATITVINDANDMAVGGIVDHLQYSGIVDGCTFSGAITKMIGNKGYPTYVGGIAGLCAGTIKNCINTGIVNGPDAGYEYYYMDLAYVSAYVGGIAGYVEFSNGLVYGCTHSGSVVKGNDCDNDTANGYLYTGSIVGSISDGNVCSCNTATTDPDMAKVGDGSISETCSHTTAE